MNIIGVKTPLFEESRSLLVFIKKHINSFHEGDILVITSKIVALSEGRVGKIEDKRKLIFKESKRVIETPWAFLTLTSDGWGINAGIDEANMKDKIVLLPKDPHKTAELLKKNLKRLYSLKKVGVIITDTRSVPLRVGTVGRAIGYSGFKPIKSYIGKKDLFGRKSRVTQSNLVDALAASAVVVMGEGSEQTPVAIIKDAPVSFTSKPLSKRDKQLALPTAKDIFSKIFTLAERDSRKSSKKK